MDTSLLLDYCNPNNTAVVVMEDDAQTLEAGMRGEVVEISGVKLILRAVEAENRK